MFNPLLSRIRLLSGLDFEQVDSHQEERLQDHVEDGVLQSSLVNHNQMTQEGKETSFKTRLLDRISCLPENPESLSLAELQLLYVKEGIHLLNELVVSVDTTWTSTTPLLGVQDKKAIEAILETIVAWGIIGFLSKDAIECVLGTSRLSLPLVDVSSFDSQVKVDTLQTVLQQLVDLSSRKTGSIPADIIQRKYFQWIFISLIISESGPNSMSQTLLDRFLQGTNTVTIISSCFSLLGKRTTPQHVRKELGQIMTNTLDRKDGINSLFTFILSSDETSSDTVPDLTRMEKISQVLLSVPAGRPKEAYFTLLWDRLVTILQGSDTLFPPLHKQAACFSLIRMVNKFKKFSEARLRSTIFRPLLCFYQEFRNKEDILVTEEDIESAVSSISRLLVGTEPSIYFLTSLTAVIPALYYIYDFASRSSSGIKNNVRDLLLTFFTVSERDASVSLLAKILTEPIYHQDLALIRPGPTGGVCFVERHHRASIPSVDGFEDKTEFDETYLNLDYFLEFLAELSNKDISPSLFLEVLKMHFTQDEDDNAQEPLEASYSSTAVGLYVWTSQVIIAMMDKFGQELLEKKAQILAFVKRMLIHPVDDEMIAMALSLLQSLLVGQQVYTESLDSMYQKELQELRIILQSLSAHADTTIASSAQMIRILLKRQDDMPTNQSSKSSNINSLSVLKQSLKDLDDELLPVRAHAIAQLKHLVLSKDPLALEYLTTIINIFLDQLHDSDSFIYLNCVKGLSAVTDVYPTETLEQIIQRYVDDTAFDMDYRLRIGEALLQTIQRAGEMFPAKVAPLFLPKLMRVLRNVDETKEIKSSAISLLSVVALHCPGTLEPFLSQVVDVLVSVVQLEKDVEPRRAVILTMSSLLRGLGPDACSTLTPSLLKAMHIQLRNIEATDKDPLSRYNARMALLDIRDAFFGTF